MFAKLSKILFGTRHDYHMGAIDLLKYIGPGLLVTVGFIDPGNWASNVAAGSAYGYKLLWMVTLSTIMLIMLQHNAAHLGIATGLCLAESATVHLKIWISRGLLATALAASVATLVAELLGGAIALQMLFNIPLKTGTLLTAGTSLFLLLTNSYHKLEKWIIGFVSLIGLSFIVEISLVHIDWGAAAVGWIRPTIPDGSMVIVMSVLGAVVMPHNLFLHSEIIQSRQWNLNDSALIERQLKFEFLDTLFSMLVGWAINSSMILMAAATFFVNKVNVTELHEAQVMLKPLLGNAAALIFAVALLAAGLSSSVTAGMAAGTIFAGLFKEHYNIQDRHSKIGVIGTLLVAVLVIFFISNPFQGLIISQMLLSVQLPFTIFLQIYLTSSRQIMGKYANSVRNKTALISVGVVVTILNVMLLASFL